MSKAEELLYSMIDPTEEVTEDYIVIGSDRHITVPDNLKRLAVQHDHNIETVTFKCPRYWDEHDMSKMTVYINYRRTDAVVGSYRADNVRIDSSDETIMCFDWVVSRYVTQVAGAIVFNVCVKEIAEDSEEITHWNSEICNDCHISEGLEFDEVIPETAYYDIVDYYMNDLIENGFKQEVIDSVSSELTDVVKVTPQTLTAEQKEQARENIGAVGQTVQIQMNIWGVDD